MIKKLRIAFFIFLMTSSALWSFNFNVTATSESCSGNGMLNFTVSNVATGGTIEYFIYKLPDLATPYATTTNPSLGGLVAGDYRVIARETVGNVVTTQQMDVTITNTIVPLQFTVQSSNQACSTTSNIEVLVTSGVAATYEIISGPITFSPQSSNTFSSLPSGIYQIRVIDSCGSGFVTTFTLTLAVVDLSIGAPSFASTSPPSCNFTIATNTLTASPGTVIGYPLQVVYTVYPPSGGTPIVINSSITSGNPTLQDLVATIPDFINQSFTYDVVVTDACNTIYSESFNVNQSISLVNSTNVLDCNENYFTLISSNFSPPYSLNFTSFPVGFNPNTFNTNYPGPYNLGSVEFGSSSMVTPIGNYVVSITDSCGRTRTNSFEIISNPPIPNAATGNNGCLSNSGNIVVAILNYQIVTAIVTAAPSSYPFTLPHDVSASIDSNGVLTLNPVPIGSYVIQLTDECNSVLAPTPAVVPAYSDLGLSGLRRPGCGLTRSSITVKSENGSITSAILTAAPSGFPFPLPYNATVHVSIADGQLYLGDLPQGNYTFTIVDSCNFTNSITVFALGYAITSSTFSLQENCGSFDIPLSFVSNGVQSQTYWLQKLLDPALDIWGHPGTDVVYPNGTVPTNVNSFPLQNNATNFNLTFNGTFRIVRHFISYNSGSDINSGAVSSINKNCIEILSPLLSFNQALQLVDAYRMPCTVSGDLDVVIEALGTAPLHYYIVEKDGVPFFLDNFNSNIFYNLPPAVYTFVVEDNCGNFVNRIFDVGTLASLIEITAPNSILQCKDIITGNEVFDISQQTPIILGTQNPADFTISYHTSLLNAQLGISPITNLTSFNPTQNHQTIYVRLVYNLLPNCYKITTFDVIVGQIPKINLDVDYLSCANTPYTLDASVGNLATTTYLWSDGSTNPTLTVSQLGATSVSVIATNTYGVGLDCTNSAATTVTLSEVAVVDRVEVVDWTVDENSITVFTSNTGSFEYSLDDMNYQDSNVFTDLIPGLYTVYIRDKNGCGVTEVTVWVLYYPRYFTPNGDGFHETWRIKNSEFEPELTVTIFDRYGKFITTFKSNTLGWDGTYNGQELFSTDYWFVVHRQDGRVHKGHFSLKR